MLHPGSIPFLVYLVFYSLIPVFLCSSSCVRKPESKRNRVWSPTSWQLSSLSIDNSSSLNELHVITDNLRRFNTDDIVWLQSSYSFRTKEFFLNSLSRFLSMKDASISGPSRPHFFQCLASDVSGMMYNRPMSSRKPLSFSSHANKAAYYFIICEGELEELVSLISIPNREFEVR